MNILLISRYFPPDIGTAANLFHELAKGLVGNGHNVTVVTGIPWYNLEAVPPQYKGKCCVTESLDGIQVVRTAAPSFGPKILKLIINYHTSTLTALLCGLFQKKPDIMYIYSPPILFGITGWIMSMFKGGVPLILGIQDLHPQAYIDQGKLKNKIVIAAFEALEKFCYRKSTLITVHSQGNKDFIVRKKGIKEDKIHILHNWLDTDEMKPLPRDNDFSRQHNLDGRFIVGYAGTLGMSQGPLSIVEAAHILKDHNDIEFFIVGDGIERAPMEQKAKEYGLSNIRFVGMQPKSVYSQVVAASDVGLVTLNSNVKTPVVPSKILSIMAAARPVLASLPLDGDAPQLIDEAQCGICIGPENPKELADKILFLAKNPETCKEYGAKGREYVVKHFSLDKALQDIEKIFEEALAMKGGKKQ